MCEGFELLWVEKHSEQAGISLKDGAEVGVLDEVGKSSFFASSPTASHRLRFAGGAEADALLLSLIHI